jgi:hypothetical protein
MTSTAHSADVIAESLHRDVDQLAAAARGHAAHYERLYARSHGLVMALRDVYAAATSDQQREARQRLARVYHEWLQADAGNFGPGA